MCHTYVLFVSTTRIHLVTINIEMFVAIILFSTVILLIHHVASDGGFASDTLSNRKFSCSGIEKKVYTEKSEIQCAQRCLRYGNCNTINYKDGDDTQENCEVFANATCRTAVSANHWKGIVFERYEIEPKGYKSCKDAYNQLRNPKNGVYELEIGPHFCNMTDIPGCGGGGWTLALKIDGTKNTFAVSSSLWTNNKLHNIEVGLKEFYVEEAKFKAFNAVPFTKVCVGMGLSTATNWLQIPIQSMSLLDIFKTGNYTSTSLGRSAWKGLIASSSLQLNCNREGFNVKDSGGSMRQRLGIFANNENGCFTPDSFIGFGGESFTCGNLASSSPDNGDKDIRAMGYLLIQ